MKNKISTKTYLNKSNSQNFYVIEIDGKSLEEIILEAQPSILRGIVPTLLNWLDNEEERNVVWGRVLPSSGNKSNLPILMCSDDIDLWCTLIIVEVEVDGEIVFWKRFGLENSNARMPDEIAKSVKWFPNIPSLKFHKKEYESVINEFRLRLGENQIYSPKENELINEYEI